MLHSIYPWFIYLSVCPRMQEVQITEELDPNRDILDFETDGALCEILRETYLSLPALKYVETWICHLSSILANQRCYRPCVIDTGANQLSTVLFGDGLCEGPYYFNFE